MFAEDNWTFGDVAEADKALFGSRAACGTSYFKLRDRKRYNRTIRERQSRKRTARG